jgi:hypothetical protein
MSRFAISAVFGASLAILVLAPVAASAAPPNQPSAAGEPPRSPAVAVPSVSCTATGTWTDQFTSGDGSWTKTAKRKCSVPGTWTDSFGYTWKLKKIARGQVSGTVNYHGVADCPHQIWPVTGTFQKKNFGVTATNPGGGGTCSSFFSYSMTIE